MIISFVVYTNNALFLNFQGNIFKFLALQFIQKVIFALVSLSSFCNTLGFDSYIQQFLLTIKVVVKFNIYFSVNISSCLFNSTPIILEYYKQELNQVFIALFNHQGKRKKILQDACDKAIEFLLLKNSTITYWSQNDNRDIMNVLGRSFFLLMQVFELAIQESKKVFQK